MSDQPSRFDMGGLTVEQPKVSRAAARAMFAKARAAMPPDAGADYDACKVGQNRQNTRPPCTPATKRGEERRRDRQREGGRGVDQLSSGKLQMRALRPRRRKGSALSDEQRSEAIEAQRGFVLGRLDAASAAIAGGDPELAQVELRAAMSASLIPNADFWYWATSQDPADVSQTMDLASSNPAEHRAAMALRFTGEGEGFEDIRAPIPEDPFPDADPELQSPISALRYRNYRAPGQPTYTGVYAALKTDGMSVSENYDVKVVSQAHVRKIMGEYKRNAWEEHLRVERMAWEVKQLEKLYQPALKGRDDEDEAEPWGGMYAAGGEPVAGGLACKQGQNPKNTDPPCIPAKDNPKAPKPSPAAKPTESDEDAAQRAAAKRMGLNYEPDVDYIRSERELVNQQDITDENDILMGAGDDWHPLVGIMGENDDPGQIKRALGAIWKVANMPAVIAGKITEAADLPEPVQKWGGRGAIVLDWVVPGVPVGSLLLASAAVGTMGARQAGKTYNSVKARIEARKAAKAAEERKQ